MRRFIRSSLGHRSVPGQKSTVFRHITVVLRKRFAKKMSSIIVGDKEHVISSGRRKRGAQGSLTWVGDWPGRQSWIFVGVIWRIHLQIFRMHDFHRMTFEFQGVGHRGIAL